MVICVRPFENWQFYSQQEEDKDLVREFFWKKHMGFLFNGTFLEVGALNGVLYSNTLMFERELSWHGILIEGCPTTAAQLENNRGGPNSRNTIVKQAVCLESGNYINYTLPCDAMSGVAGRQGDAVMVREHDRKESVPVPCSPLSEMIRSANVFSIDLVSIDVEGYEVSLLKTINFTQVSIGVIVIEVNHNNDIELQEVKKILTESGFISRGLQGRHYANEIWVNPRYKRLGEQWVPIMHKHVQWSQWRLQPCTDIPASNMVEIVERDRKNDSTNFEKYVASFGKFEHCSRPPYTSN